MHEFCTLNARIWFILRQVIRRGQRDDSSSSDDSAQLGAVGGSNMDAAAQYGNTAEDDEDEYLTGIIEVEPPGAYDFLWNEVQVKQVCTISLIYTCHD